MKKYLGEDALTAATPWMASESMNMYLKLWPGVITFTGIQNDELGSGANHHTAEFDLDEQGMISGVAAALGYVKDFWIITGKFLLRSMRTLCRILWRGICKSRI